MTIERDFFDADSAGRLVRRSTGMEEEEEEEEELTEEEEEEDAVVGRYPSKVTVFCVCGDEVDEAAEEEEEEERGGKAEV